MTIAHHEAAAHRWQLSSGHGQRKCVGHSLIPAKCICRMRYLRVMFTLMELGARVGQMHTMTVTVGVSLSSVKAAEVLEQYGREKVRRRLYMREYRKPEGERKKGNGEDRSA